MVEHRCETKHMHHDGRCLDLGQTITKLKELISKTIRGTASAARIIQMSPEVRRWSQPNIRKRTGMIFRDVRRRVNVRAAKHRFETFSTPLTRACRVWPSLMQTVSQLANARRDKLSKAAKNFLENLTEPDVVFLGACADGAEEMISLTRFCDNEDVAIAEICERVADCVSNLVDMCGDVACKERRCYTKMLLARVRRPVVISAGGKTWPLG